MFRGTAFVNRFSANVRAARHAACMPPETGTALLILVAFVLPGFATVLFKERMHEAGRDVSPLERVLQAGYYAVWSYVLLAGFCILLSIERQDIEDLYGDHKGAPADLVWRAGLAIVAPAFVVANASRIWEGSQLRRRAYEKVGVNARHRVSTTWDYVFSLRRSLMVRATLRGGEVVGGYYGAESFSAYAKDGRDLYVERQWTMDADGWFEQEAPDTRGLWIPGEEVVWVAFYDPANGGKEEAKDRRGAGRSSASKDGEAATEGPAAEATP